MTAVRIHDKTIYAFEFYGTVEDDYVVLDREKSSKPASGGARVTALPISLFGAEAFAQGEHVHGAYDIRPHEKIKILAWERLPLEQQK